MVINNNNNNRVNNSEAAAGQRAALSPLLDTFFCRQWYMLYQCRMFSRNFVLFLLIGLSLLCTRLLVSYGMLFCKERQLYKELL
jgi:hypothetical protein